MILTRSNDSTPPQSYIADGTGSRLAWVEENALDAGHPYTPFLASHRPVTYGTVPAEDGTPLHWEMVTPELEPGRRYPVYFYHYGGPGPQIVNKGWDGALRQAIVDRGYIWFALDNRGSAHRGVAFEQPLYRAMGGAEVRDQKAGAEYLKTLPFVDPQKIAIDGWSYGGYMTLKQLQADPGLYAAGIAGAPVTDWALYDTHYQGPLRPDHGRMIWGEQGMPGYGLYDRALGTNYLLGLWDAICRDHETGKAGAGTCS